jgi:hypothetical protein
MPGPPPGWIFNPLVPWPAPGETCFAARSGWESMYCFEVELSGADRDRGGGGLDGKQINTMPESILSEEKISSHAWFQEWS